MQDFYDDVENWIDVDKIELLNSIGGIPYDESIFVKPTDDIVEMPIF